MPRNDGVSGRSTTWFILFRPRLRTITLCFSGVQIGLLTSLILILESDIVCPFGCRTPLPGGSVLKLFRPHSADFADRLGGAKLLERVDGRLHGVMGVSRTD